MPDSAEKRLKFVVNGADPKRGRQNQAAKFRSGCKARGGTNRVLVFCPSEKLVLLWDYADVGCKSARYERHEKLFASKNSLKCSTANKFRKQRLSLILDQKVLQ